jgi:tripartite-type tricarboxylate transporter receptor subunit TctC
MERLLAFAALAAAAGIASSASAQAPAAPYPSRQITLITLTAAGGALDTVARAIGNGLQEQMGQPVVVVNRLGAGGNIGTTELARSAPDGYTIGMLTVGTHGTNPTFVDKPPFDPIKDFTPISMAADLNIMLTVQEAFPAKTLAEFIAYSKKNPGKLTFGSAGVGTGLHLTGEMVKRVTGLDMTHVPYQGVAKALPDLLGGQIQAVMGNPADVGVHIEAGKLKALAVAATKRDATLPKVPTFTEQGFPTILSSTWFGVGGPAGLPRPIVDRLNKEIGIALRNPATTARLNKLGINVLPGTPEQFGDYIKSEIARWNPIVTAVKATLKKK